MRTLTVQTENDHWKLAFKEKPIPEPGTGACLVKLKAAALNRRDYWISIGKYPGIRSGTTLGSDGCGVVEQGSKEWIGKEVWINPNINWGENPAAQSAEYSILGTPEDGALAEYIVVPADRLIEKPGHLTMEEAAAVPLAGLTAYRAVFSKAKVTKGDRVLITGIGGGVSQFALSYCVAIGAEVSVTSSNAAKISKAQAQGAIRGFDYKEDDWVKQASAIGKFDAIIDSAGGNSVNDYLKLIRPGGKIVFYGSTTGKPEQIDLFRLFWSQAIIYGSTMGNDKEFALMTHFVSKNGIKPTIDKVYEFDNAIKAIEEMRDLDHYGKKVISISS